MTDPTTPNSQTDERLRADDFEPGTLVHKFLRYAEINEATETRVHERPATNCWAVGFREAAARITELEARVKELEGALAALSSRNVKGN